MYTYGNVTVFDKYGNLVTMPNYASWIDMALDDSKTLTEKMEMLLTMVEYAKSLPDDWPKWSDGSPIMAGQIAMSLHGPMVIGAVVDGALLTLTGYEIDAAELPCRIGEYQEFWPGNDEHFAEHILYHEATGAIGPQCEGGRYTWEAGVLGYDEYNDDVRLPQKKGVDPSIPPDISYPVRRRVSPKGTPFYPIVSNEGNEQ